MAEESLGNEEMIDSTDNFEAAYESHSRSIYRFLYWRTRNVQLSEDLTSSVFEKAWRSRSSFHGGSVRAWLYRIARNVLIDHWRKKQDLLVEDVDSLPEEAAGSSISDQLDQDIMLRRLHKALDTLPSDMRAVINLRFIEGLSCKQVAEKLELGESNVRVIQYRALRKLRSRLK
jgi:RNA polymerase sigma-70 factor (ECF subfamily)